MAFPLRVALKIRIQVAVMVNSFSITSVCTCFLHIICVAVEALSVSFLESVCNIILILKNSSLIDANLAL